MGTRRSAGALLLLTLASACQNTTGDAPAALETDDQKASYGIGRQMGAQLFDAREHLDMASLTKGIEDAFVEADFAVPQEELQTILQTFSQTIQQEQMAQRNEEATRNRQEGAAYLEENGAREGVVTTGSGLQYEVLREGDGRKPTPSDRVTIHYRGTLIDGTEFDSSYGGEPATFAVGGVIAGFSEGLQLMSEGSHYRFVIPSDIAYGPQGSQGAIGPDATLIFEVELLEIPG